MLVTVGHSSPPVLDDALRTRLVTRYGDGIASWLDALPASLIELGARWRVGFGDLIQRGNMSVVIRCVLSDGQPGVLKVCPDRDRLASEAAALQRWRTRHVPTVHAVDTTIGALLMGAVVPGTMLLEAPTYPAGAVAQLLRSLHADGIPDPSYPPVAQHIAYLFDSWARHRELHPELLEIVPGRLFDRGRRRAEQLAEDASPTVLLHGDLTPVNVLDGGQRGLVAIDPAPCLGDPAFDAVDLLFWEAADVATIVDRAELLGSALGVAASRLLDWCIAFAGMIGSELAATPGTSPARVRTALTLAEQDSV
jgi:streptomycin 6-kinase